MPRNHDEALEWPEEATPDLKEVLMLIDLELSEEEEELYAPVVKRKPNLEE